ncbi:MAG: amidase [Actinomycetota bacterium]|nr:amidase [Actinomycetota bacterium]
MAQLHDLTALEQGQAIARREVSSLELTEHYLARAEQLDATVGAFAIRTPELARKHAVRADAEVGGVDFSPLHGVVIPPKDLHSWAGVRCRLGSRAIDFVPDADDYPVIRMREAGFVFTGKTNTSEFGLPAYTESEVSPPARTPWDLQRSAGGSSGGAAAAVASGLAAAAVGSDGGGSIRIPASCCGLVGIKPSRGRVSVGPSGESLGELGVHGPLARTVADAAAVLDALCGSFAGDRSPAPALAAGDSFLLASKHQPRSLRVARFATPILVPTTVGTDCLNAYESASVLLAELGHEVEEIEMPFGAELFACFAMVWSCLAAAIPLDAAQEEEVTPLTRWLRAEGNQVTGPELTVAISALRTLARKAMQRTSAYDVILTPGLAQLPPEIGSMRNDSDPAADFAAQSQFTPFTAPFNLTGQPAINLPLHWTAAGLPVGVQLVGRIYDEYTLISLAAQLESAQPWTTRRPAIW